MSNTTIPAEGGATDSSSSNVVHFTWNEDLNEKFPQVLEYRQKWQDAGYEVRVTPNAQIRDTIVRMDKQLGRTDLVEKFDGLETDNMRYDFWRYAILYLEGGVYSDVDVYPLPKLMDYLDNSRTQNVPTFFEGSSYPDWPIFQYIVPKVSDYTEIPSWDTCVVVSGNPSSTVLVEFLDAVDMDAWRNEREPKKTLMIAGPGKISEFIRDRTDVIKVYHKDRKGAYHHTGFGTWKSGWALEYVVLSESGVVCAIVVAIVLLNWIVRKRKCVWCLMGIFWRQKEKLEDEQLPILQEPEGNGR